jgi:AraC-like DNA-binding protein
MLLRAGDMVVLPHSTGHVLADVVERPTRPIDELPQEAIDDFTYKLRVGRGGAQTLIFCGSVHFDVPLRHPLVELLPHVLLVSDATTHDTTLPLLLTLMADEVRAERIGAATVLARLANVVIARVIRAWAEAHGADATGWLAAIRDPQIGHALAAIHRHPGHPWSVALLAAVAYSSRSLFSARFTAVVGVSPARYLTRWRMHVASGWLRTERLTVAEVAARLGYQSEASFRRAFKRHVGVKPHALRSGDEGCR